MTKDKKKDTPIILKGNAQEIVKHSPKMSDEKSLHIKGHHKESTSSEYHRRQNMCSKCN